MPPATTDPCAGLGDYHLHTHFSDGEGEPAEFVERAIELGLTEIGFADHLVPPGLGEAGDYGVPLDRLDEYVDAVRAVAAAYPEIGVLCSVEADYLPAREDDLAAILRQYPFDYVLGSVHFVGDFDFADEAKRHDARWDDPDDLFRGYYDATRRAAESGLFDVIAHVGYVALWGHEAGPRVAGAERAALQAIADAGTVLEINTGGPLDPLELLYPFPHQLVMANDMGTRITLSSDAHCPDQVAMLYADGLALARGAGFTTAVRLSDGSDVPLPG